MISSSVLSSSMLRILFDCAIFINRKEEIHLVPKQYTEMKHLYSLITVTIFESEPSPSITVKICETETI